MPFLIPKSDNFLWLFARKIVKNYSVYSYLYKDPLHLNKYNEMSTPEVLRRNIILLAIFKVKPDIEAYQELKLLMFDLFTPHASCSSTSLLLHLGTFWR